MDLVVTCSLLATVVYHCRLCSLLHHKGDVRIWNYPDICITFQGSFVKEMTLITSIPGYNSMTPLFSPWRCRINSSIMPILMSVTPYMPHSTSSVQLVYSSSSPYCLVPVSLPHHLALSASPMYLPVETASFLPINHYYITAKFYVCNFMTIG